MELSSKFIHFSVNQSDLASASFKKSATNQNTKEQEQEEAHAHQNHKSTHTKTETNTSNLATETLS